MRAGVVGRNAGIARGLREISPVLRSAMLVPLINAETGEFGPWGQGGGPLAQPISQVIRDAQDTVEGMVASLGRWVRSFPMIG